MDRLTDHIRHFFRRHVFSFRKLQLSFTAFFAFSSIYLIYKHRLLNKHNRGSKSVCTENIVSVTNIPRESTTEQINSYESLLNCTSEMRLVPGGAFMMGGQLEHPIRSIYISDFWMDSTEITKEKWDQVREWAIKRGYDIPVGRSHGGSDHPVVFISWHDATKWLNARSEMIGLRPAYYIDVNCREVYRQGVINPTVDWSAGFRLPTEAEWEKAGRGGMDGYEFSWTQDNLISTNRCNYNQSKLGGTLPVGSYPPNGFGLYDMCGNVAEWCWDYWAPYPNHAQSPRDPKGAISGVYRVIRGGSWSRPANRCRIAFRYFFFTKSSNIRAHDLGFRSVIVLI